MGIIGNINDTYEYKIWIMRKFLRSAGGIIGMILSILGLGLIANYVANVTVQCILTG